MLDLPWHINPGVAVMALVVKYPAVKKYIIALANIN
jgi:hypothetical protein